MSYMLDLDEIREAALEDELRMRRAERAAGNCDYCHRPQGTEKSCKFPERHRGEVSSEAIEDQVVVWHDREWRNPDGSRKMLDQVGAKLGEEAGEAIAATVKIVESRTDKDWHAELYKEMGDTMIVLSCIAGRFGWTLDQIRAKRWADVKHRTSANTKANGSPG